MLCVLGMSIRNECEQCNKECSIVNKIFAKLDCVEANRTTLRTICFVHALGMLRSDSMSSFDQPADWCFTVCGRNLRPATVFVFTRGKPSSPRH